MQIDASTEFSSISLHVTGAIQAVFSALDALHAAGSWAPLLQISLLLLLLLIVRALWHHWLLSVSAREEPALYTHDGSYPILHTLIRWPGSTIAVQSAPEPALSSSSLLEEDVPVLPPGYSQCSFLPEHEGWLASCSLPVVQLRTYAVMPHARAGNGFADPARVRAILVWISDIPVSGRHAAHLAIKCANEGIAFHCCEHRGFGESKGQCHRVRRWEDLVEDQSAFITHVCKKQAAETPLFLGGSGFGATIALLLTMRPTVHGDVAGLLLLSPALEVCLSPRLRSLAMTLGSIVPWLRCIPLAELALQSRNKAVAAHLQACGEYSHDDTSFLPVGTVQQLLCMVDRARATFTQSLNVPFLVQVGVRDLICAPGGSRNLVLEADGVARPARSIRAWSTCWHDLLHECEGEAVVAEMILWIDERVRCRDLAKTLD